MKTKIKILSGVLFLLVIVFLIVFFTIDRTPKNRKENETIKQSEKNPLWQEDSSTVEYIDNTSIPDNFIPKPGEKNIYIVTDEAGNIKGYKKRIAIKDSSNYVWGDSDIKNPLPDELMLYNAEQSIYYYNDNNKAKYYRYDPINYKLSELNEDELILESTTNIATETHSADKNTTVQITTEEITTKKLTQREQFVEKYYDEKTKGLEVNEEISQYIIEYINEERKESSVKELNKDSELNKFTLIIAGDIYINSDYTLNKEVEQLYPGYSMSQAVIPDDLANNNKEYSECFFNSIYKSEEAKKIILNEKYTCISLCTVKSSDGYLIVLILK